MVKIIESNGLILAKHISTNEMKEGLSFNSADGDYIQVGTWRYNTGKELLAHVHNEVERTVLRTQEVLVIKTGSILAKIYDEAETLVAEIVVGEGDILILLNGAHGYSILEENTQVIEIKNGPYLGAEVDRRRICG